MPCLINPEGKILYSTGVQWTDVDLKHPLKEALSIPVHIDNDADCALMAERFFGECKSSQFLCRSIAASEPQRLSMTP